jgi:hypothetical protein
MAASHVLVLPTTDEAFSWHVIETKTNQIISRHRNLRLVLDKAERLNIEAALARGIREEVPRCGYQDDRHELPCDAPATGTEIETGCTFCASHKSQDLLA